MSGQQQIFAINGLIDTNKSVWKNAETIASAAASWITWDPFTFEYGVVINRPGSSIRSFNDDNIVGAITITETPMENIYNACEVRYPNRDIRDRVDYIRYDEPVAARFDNEPENRLTIEFDIVNEQIQADVIAITELKQNRQNKTISFTTDFTNLDLAPGDIVDVTNELWDFDQTLFRIVELTQTDTVDGEIFLDVIAVEYNSEVYNYTGLNRFSRSVSTGIPSLANNAAVQTVSDQTTGVQVGRALETDAGKTAISNGGVPLYSSFQSGFSTTALDTALNSGQNFGAFIEITKPEAGSTYKLLQISFEGPQAIVDYDTVINGTAVSRTYQGAVPLIVELQYSADGITYVPIQQRFFEWSGNTGVFTVVDGAQGFYQILAEKTDTLDLNQEGSSATVTINTVATISAPGGDAATINFLILE
jgi:hypothetical protein